MYMLIFLLLTLGGLLLVWSLCPGPYAPAGRTLRKHAPRRLTRTELAVSALARRIQPLVELDPVKRAKLENTLISLGRKETPEAFHARALVQGLLTGGGLLVLVLFSVPLGLALAALMTAAVYRRERQKLDQEMDQRRQRIERELPQFAATIQQSLSATRDVAAILAAYGRVCGPALADEIQRTLNDLATGNAERAIKALEARVASPKLAQLTWGLISVLRGDDQRVYFEVLASEYRKEQMEAAAKALQLRPQKLLPYMALLFACLALMLIAGLGQSMVQHMTAMFG